jgi:hypothetical protein
VLGLNLRVLAVRCWGSCSYGMEDFFAPLVAKACLQVMPAGASSFNVDSVRVNKIIGGSFGMSTLVNGMVVPRDTEGASPRMLSLTIRCSAYLIIASGRDGENYVQCEGRCVQCGSGGNCDRK